MRLEELYIDGFGHFYERTVGPLPGRVTIFYGPNEAGKSTLLAFIRAMLFGFPTRFNRHYPPLAGGRHGGRVKLSNAAGNIYDVERYAGASGGLSIVTPSGPASDAETVLRQLTGPATSDIFKTVFAFSLDELQEAASLQGSGIYSAGQGVPRLPKLQKELSDRKGKIYLSRGNNQEVPKLLNTLKDVDEQLKAVADNASRYGGLAARKSEIGRELQDADAELSQLNARRAEIDNLLNGWDAWLDLFNCETQLRDLPRFEQFPENPIARLESLEDRARQSREVMDDAAEQVRLTGEASAAPIPGENLLDDASRIEDIRRARSSFDNSVKDLPERRAELGALEKNLVDRLKDLGPDWDETQLVNFDASIGVRQEVEGAKDILSQRQESSHEAQRSLAQANAALTERQTDAREAQERMPVGEPPLDAAGLAHQRDALRAAHGRFDEYERSRQNHENLRGQFNSLTAGQESADSSARPALLLPVLLAVAGVAMIGAGVVIGDAALFLGLIGGIVLLLAAAYQLAPGRSAPAAANPLVDALSRQAVEAEAKAEATRQLLVEAAGPLVIEGDVTGAALAASEARIDSAAAALTAWGAAMRLVEETQSRLASQQQRVDEATQQRDATDVAEGNARREWQGWLGRKGLPISFTPDTVVDFMSRVETTRAIQQQAQAMRDRVRAIKDDINEFRLQVAPLASAHSLTLDAENQRQLAAVADELIKKMEEVWTHVSGRERAKEQHEENRRLLERQEQRLHSVERDLAELLKAGGADDPEEFRRRAVQNEERLNLEQQRDEHRRILVRLSGPGDKFDAFRELLANSDPNELAEKSGRLSARQAEVDDQCNALREERGGIDTDLARLTSEEDSSALRVRQTTLLEQLQEQAREWSRLTIAESLLKKTQQKFELERQPGVIRHAQDFFANVTGHRYNRLYAPIDEQTITVTDTTGRTKQPSELSRGAREQLYLALRFGLIRDFGEHAERLPVVVDEALVNFDQERARLAAESFAELAETNQVLVFTCHPATADLFQEAAGAQVVDISHRLPNAPFA